MDGSIDVRPCGGLRARPVDRPASIPFCFGADRSIQIQRSPLYMISSTDRPVAFSIAMSL
jgi:hypothetical protein